MARIKVFDTNAMVAVSQGQLTVAPADTHVVISIITRIELLAWPDLPAEAREQVRQMVESVETAPITGDIEEQVIELRTARLLKLPDAIIAATAIVRSAPLVTMDSTFRRVPGLIVETF